MKKIALLFMSATLFLTSCKDFLNMPPKNTKVVYTIDDVRQITSSLLFAITSSSSGANSSNNISFNDEYIQYPFSRAANVSLAMYTNDMNMVNFIIPESEETDGGDRFSKEFFENNNWEGYTFSKEIWDDTFNCVGFINMILKDLEKVPDSNKTDFERISGEVRVMRAYFLLRLNQLFAPLQDNDMGIPFNLDADVVKEGARWKQTDLYETLIQEIMDVLSYETLPKDGWNIFYSKKVIYGILAQTYLYKACGCAAEGTDWENAQRYAAMARDNNPIEKTVDEQEEASIIPLKNVIDRPHRYCLVRFSLRADGPGEFSPWGWGDALQAATSDLYDLYDETDIRRGVYFDDIDGEGWLKKLSYDPAGTGQVVNDVHLLFRYSDLFLIEAEALARQGKTGEALTMLNQFKADKIPGYTGYEGSDLIGEILKERRKEFVLEEQINWIDMKRTNVKVVRDARADDGRAVGKYTLEPNDYRYTLPLPDSELKYNTISQNPGWKK